MAHFAQLNEQNTVIKIIVINNNELYDENGIEQEQKGIDFCKSLYGSDTIWKQTSYNARQRKNYAGVGYTYDSDLDAFIAPKPFDSWSLDEIKCQWIPPVPIPTDGLYSWNEDSQSWQLYTEL
jgi:hypothetical protein